MNVIIIYDIYIYAYKNSYIYVSICYDEVKYGTVIHETVRTIYGTYMHLQGLYIKHCPSYMNMPYMMELIWINVRTCICHIWEHMKHVWNNRIWEHIIWSLYEQYDFIYATHHIWEWYIWNIYRSICSLLCFAI